MIKLKDVCDIIGDGLHGTPVFSDNGNYYFVNGNNLSNGKIEIYKDTKKCDESQYNLYKKDLTDRTILLSINGTIGNLAYYNGENIILGKSACYLNIKKEYDKRFMYYVFSDQKFQQYIKEYATGTTIKNTGLQTIRNFEFDLPKKEEQKAIADVLSSFDYKIELNNKIIKNLEEQAQSLYKHWFIDFEFLNEEGKPYKSSGGKFKESELGLIPEDWDIKKLGDFFPVITGKKNANVVCTSGQYPFFSCSQDILYCNEFSFDNSAILVAGNGDFSVKVYEGKFEAYQRTYVLIPNEKKMLGFLYYAIKSNLEKLTSGFRGSVIKFITKGHIEDFKLAYHDKMNQHIECFTNTIRTKAQLLFENKKLEETRDYLLQKLMSGEIKVTDVK